MAEIKYWKQNKLLPEQYCDFLVALYSNGDKIDVKEIKVSNSVLIREKKKRVGIILLILILAMSCIATLFLLNAHPLITFGIPFIVICLQMLYALSGDSFAKFQILPLLYISNAFILLAVSLKFWSSFFDGQVILLIGILLINSVLWLFAGRLLNLIYFTISGIVGTLLVVGFVFIQF